MYPVTNDIVSIHNPDKIVFAVGNSAGLCSMHGAR
jgi:hypothetical protein